jgi:membrane associated rhomboid family serine protease
MFRNLTPVVRALFYANVAVFLLEYVAGDFLLANFALWPVGPVQVYGALGFEPWQLVTYAFLHDPQNIWHIFGNMLALYMFGPDIERTLGRGRFSVYYFACVIGAGLTQLAVTHFIFRSPYPTLGASGGIFGLLLFYGLTFPHRRVLLLFPPIPMPAWLFVTLYGVLELGLGVFGTKQGVAHFAHLGGMATGFLLIHYWRTRHREQSYL